ncbi:MAG: hypothetical protein DRQ55_14325 [Planctomycetota bacterium]|nr:MAG: hypothetical protein DRQ55_14325 [Planctomycetota bacterium]
MMLSLRCPRPLVLLASFAALLCVAGCGGDEPAPATPPGTAGATPPGAAGAAPGTAGAASEQAQAAARVEADLPTSIDVPSPSDPITSLDVVEDMSEAVANSLVELAAVLRRRDYGQVDDWLAKGFAGHAPASLPALEPELLALGARRDGYDPAGAAIVGPAGFVASLEQLLSVFTMLESVVIKVKGAEFQRAAIEQGRVRLKLSAFGLAQGGRPLALTLWGHAGVVRERGRWRLRRFSAESLSAEHRSEPLFVDVTAGAGVANRRDIFGKDGQTLFYWNGAASGDVNGDGRWDLFVPSTGRSFLYLSAGDGTFSESSEAWGLSAERDGTGCLFFDSDADGDTDLVVSHVGWTRSDGAPGGDSMRHYRNDGEGFTDVSEASGLNGRHVAFSLVGGDFDGDGWVDIYVCSYNRMDAIYPESWYHAENGTPNALYRNLGDGRFEDVAAAWGADDARWTFAAAAADYDEDGDLDLYLANDYGENALLQNQGDGHFVDRAAELGVLDPGNGMATAWGDIDRDGRLDLYVANMSSTAGNRILSRLVPEDDAGVGSTLQKLAGGNSVFRVGDDFSFERQPAEAGATGAAWAWSSCFLDADLDGCQDIFVANGFISGESAADT